jgi:hypothetical protein
MYRQSHAPEAGNLCGKEVFQQIGKMCHEQPPVSSVGLHTLYDSGDGFARFFGIHCSTLADTKT